MSLNKVRPCSINLNIRKWGENMKKLGKKLHIYQATIEAYANCDSYCHCDYAACGNTSAMVNLMANVRNVVSSTM